MSEMLLSGKFGFQRVEILMIEHRGFQEGPIAYAYEDSIVR